MKKTEETEKTKIYRKDIKFVTFNGQNLRCLQVQFGNARVKSEKRNGFY